MSMSMRIGMTCALVAGLAVVLVTAQAAPRQATPAPAGKAGATAKVDATLAQLMRGVVYPASNVVFAAQGDLGKFPAAADPAVSPNPLTSTYGGWQAVENASLALAESVNLLMLPGRLCSNGKPAPVRRADWAKFADGLRQAGMASYKAAQKKDQDAMVEASGAVADACSACHEVYRDRAGGSASRCTP
jgi:hypothetical protein